MALASSLVYHNASELFRLFRSVIPHFASIAKQRVSEYRGNDKLRIPYVLFESDLLLLDLRTNALARLAFLKSTLTSKDAFVERIAQILGMLERMLPQEQVSAEDHLAYPLLERISAGTVPCDTFDLCISDDGDPYATVAEFSGCARELDRLCFDDSQLLAPRRHKKQPSFEKTRVLAKLLYECVSDHWQCDCNSCHGTMLYLQTYCNREPSGAHLDFNMLLTRSLSASYKWYELNVDVTLPDPGSISVLPRSQKDLGPDSSHIVTSTYTLTTKPKAPQMPSVTVNSICLALPQSNMTILSLDIQNGKISKRRPPREQASASTYNQALTLEEVLQMTPPLPLKLRRVLAVVLSHSALQLFETRWLPSTLTSTRVVFMKTDQNHIVLRPLLAARLLEPDEGNESKADWQDLAHSSPFVLSLGIILLELWFGKHISELRDAADMSPDGVEDPNTDLFTAQRLWEQSEWDMQIQYRNAVGACVNWESWDPDNMDPARLCQRLYENVVSPIEDQLADEFSTNIEDVDSLLLSLGKSKNKRTMALAHQKRLLKSDKRPHPDVLVHASPVKRRQMTNHCKLERSCGSPPDSADEQASYLNTKEFTVAVVCVLGVESNAVITVMDEVYETLPEAARQDGNAYTTGRIGTTSIVVVHLAGMGKLNAANSVTRLKWTFPSVGLCLVVGVCGGAPYNFRTKQDIVLGDVIVSTGLKQADFGRHYPNGFAPKDDPEDNFGRPVERLRSFLRMLSETDHYYRRIADSMNSTLKTYLQSATGQSLEYPGANMDHLYESSYQHQCGSERRCGTCNPTTGTVCQYALDTSCDRLGCQPKHIKARPRLREHKFGDVADRLRMIHHNPTGPIIHFGRVACGDGVMKSARDRDRLVEKYNVIGFEMEAAGAWDTFPTVVVKGVCDYADSHKNKLWQGYSAAVAASCMKALLAQWSSRTS